MISDRQDIPVGYRRGKMVLLPRVPPVLSLSEFDQPQGFAAELCCQKLLMTPVPDGAAASDTEVEKSEDNAKVVTCGEKNGCVCARVFIHILGTQTNNRHVRSTHSNERGVGTIS